MPGAAALPLALLLLFLSASRPFKLVSVGAKSRVKALSMSSNHVTIADFLSAVQTSLSSSEDRFLSITCKNNRLLERSSLERDGVTSLKEVRGRIVSLKKGDVLQLQYRYLTNDQVKNYAFDEVSDILNRLVLETGFDTLSLLSASQRTELNVRRSPRSADIVSARIKSLPVQKNEVEDLLQQPRTHNRVKCSPLLPIDSAYLRTLGLTYRDSTGAIQLKSNMADKFAQITGFLEVLDSLLSRLASQSFESVEVLDLGCGKGYLTFAAHHLLQTRFSTAKICTTGVEIRPDLVRQAEAQARALSKEERVFENLHFICGDIATLTQSKKLFQHSYFHNTSTTSTNNDTTLRILLGLHACDTATDDLLIAGAELADVVVGVSCCQKELRPQIDAHWTQAGTLSAILKHASYRERCAEMLTDSLRALCMEAANFDTKIFDFVPLQHTPKNVMLTAVRRRSTDEASIEAAKKQIAELMELFGVRHQRLVSHCLHLDADLPPQLPVSRKSLPV
jgi:SAM-dependent methyltransferase